MFPKTVSSTPTYKSGQSMFKISNREHDWKL